MEKPAFMGGASNAMRESRSQTHAVGSKSEKIEIQRFISTNFEKYNEQDEKQRFDRANISKGGEVSSPEKM